MTLDPRTALVLRKKAKSIAKSGSGSGSFFRWKDKTKQLRCWKLDEQNSNILLLHRTSSVDNHAPEGITAAAQQVLSMRILSCGALLALALLVTQASAQFGGEPEASPVKSDLPYIRCAVCETVAKNAYRQVKAARDALKPGKKLEELVILEMVEKMGDPAKDEGEWIAKIDLVEDGKKLKLVEHEELGKCREECKTIQRAAQEILSDHDTDIAEKLWQGKLGRAQFSNWLCYELTGACAKKPPPLPKDRAPGQAFQVIDPQEAQMQKMMAGMKDMGMGGQMYDRASVERMVGKGGDPYSEDDDEDEEEDEAAEEKPAGEAASAVESTLEGAKEVLNKAKDVAEAAVDQAKEGLSKAYTSAKNIVSGLTSGAAKKTADTAEAEL